MFTKSFKNLSKDDVAIAGGKGASLGEMTQAGIPVPPGFVVLSGAFERFIEETNLNVEIDAKLHNVDHNVMHTVEEASEKIQSLILSIKMPEDIAEEVQKEFKKLGAKYVAVRSSATAEDSSSAAWAGQLDSFLNTTEGNLLENVRKCWASLFTPRAIFYRFEQNLHKQKISVAVVVQKMVESEISGIAFSVHPVTQDRNQLIIEAGLGLGEAIVSGSITPDGYVVEKEPRRIIDKNINIQEGMLARAESGGNKWQDILKEKGEKSVLTDEQILEFTKLVLNIEEHYGFPCDIEWAFEEGEFYITQSRPITTLDDKNKIKKEKQEYGKVMNRDLSLLDCELWDESERIIFPKLYDGCISFDPLFVFKKGKAVDVYYNFTDEKQEGRHVINYFNKHEDELDILIKKFAEDIKEMKRLEKKQSIKDFEKLFQLVKNIWVAVNVSLIIINNEDSIEGIKPSVLGKCIKIRKDEEEVLHIAVNILLKKARKLVKKEYKDWVDVLLYNEIVTENYPNFKELEERKNGYVFHRGVLYVGEIFEKYANRNNFTILRDVVSDENFKNNQFCGEVAYNGIVKGVVSIVFNKDDINKVKEGDILVSPMTTPDFILAIKKADAFITDEGGIMCHAAIVAREMKKPCIIGTKIATQVLKDGDLVEVDADNGVVNILDKKH